MTQNIMCHFLLLSVLYLELCVSSLHPFVVKTSPIFDAMGHTSVFPIAENGRVACFFSAPFCGQNSTNTTLADIRCDGTYFCISHC